jgi:hypothetical protein
MKLELQDCAIKNRIKEQSDNYDGERCRDIRSADFLVQKYSMNIPVV